MREGVSETSHKTYTQVVSWRTVRNIERVSETLRRKQETNPPPKKKRKKISAKNGHKTTFSQKWFFSKNWLYRFLVSCFT